MVYHLLAWSSYLLEIKGTETSISEAEYVAISEAVKGICFTYYLLESIGMNVKLPVVVRCDDVGAINMTEN
jgi:hypothetical protein